MSFGGSTDCSTEQVDETLCRCVPAVFSVDEEVITSLVKSI